MNQTAPTVSTFKKFEQIQPGERFVGGKAFVLSQLAQMSLPVPPGAVLTELPSEETWREILAWWKEHGSAPLAVRSSGRGEDSEGLSYAGQQRTFLNVRGEEELADAVARCFQSDARAASRSYREHFGQAARLKMNVILQVMVDPLYSGVYFTFDPRGSDKAGWLIEMTEGLGEKLVSGQVDPYRLSPRAEHTPGEWSEKMTADILNSGAVAERHLRTPVDMEWAVDRDRRFWVLQARPITTRQDDRRAVFEEELLRLKKEHAPDTVWDGQTFSDWAGCPSELTFHLWRKAFSEKGAFLGALKELGYLGETAPADGSVLERIYGRAYMNLHRLEPLYFGRIPYRIEADPRPHLKFDPKKIDMRMILNTPRPLSRMLKVAWRLKTRRLRYIEAAKAELIESRKHASSTQDFRGFSDREVFGHWGSEIEEFCSLTMKWPFVLTFLIESTLQNVQLLLKKVEEPQEAEAKLRRWMSAGLHTLTREMADELEEASTHPERRLPFLKKFGHRGPGEMDLARPRWSERPPRWRGAGTDLDSEKNSAKSSGRTPVKNILNVDFEIEKYGLMKASVISQEWNILKKLLELREEWKNQILRPYLDIRRLTLEIGRRFNLRDEIFWLQAEEIRRLENRETPADGLAKIAAERKTRVEKLGKVSLPPVISLGEIEKHFGAAAPSAGSLQGEGLSVGIAHGTAVVLSSPENADLSSLPENLILVTETIDPGWTSVFRRSKAIVTEHGGVLSHAAIVAREMGIPAVSRLPGATRTIATGAKVWVDGTKGLVTIEDENGSKRH